jgi:hypothetical protein
VVAVVLVVMQALEMDRAVLLTLDLVAAEVELR